MWIADPKAISHILHSGDLWVKSTTNREMNAVLLGKGLVWAEGDVHKRQRKALTPAFGLGESKALMSRFLLVANKVRMTGVLKRFFFKWHHSNSNSRFHLVYSWPISGRTWPRTKLEVLTL